MRFPVRSGFVRELLGGVTRWLRAVDGVSFDLRRGEILCLVGESGCGKTTTGKALLRLVEANEGDVFFEMGGADFRRLEELRAQDDPAAAAEIEDLRRKYSFTWKESLAWTRRQVVTAIGAILIASLLAVAIPALATAFLGTPLYATGSILGVALAVAFLLGIVSMLPPVRPTRRVSAVLAILSIVLIVIAQLLGFVLRDRLVAATPGGFDAGSAYGNLWSTDPFTMLLAYVFAPIVTAATSRGIVSVRLTREGHAGIVMRTLRKRLHLIFQDPYESLNPKQSVYEIVSEPLRVNRLAASSEETMARVVRALEDAGLHPASEFLLRFPHELSGGQRQRVSIAAALVLEPDFIVADEPVSMLDVSIRTEILQLLLELRQRRGLTYLFITHDLSLAWVIADRIAVMYLGKIVEIGNAEQVIRQPKHPYTQALISVVPSPDPRHRATRMILKGERPDPVNIPTGCRFHPRCPMAFEKCGWNAEEVSEALQEAEREIAARIGGAILERQARVADLRKLVTGSGTEPQDLEEQAKALEKEIQGLRSGRTRALELANAVRAAGPRAVSAIPPASMTADELVENLKALVNAQRNTRLPFKGVADIAATSGGVTIRLHPWSEPDLVEVAPGNSVACYLVSPLPKEEPAVEPIP